MVKIVCVMTIMALFGGGIVLANFSDNSDISLPPTYKNVKYGPHENNLLDFWQADSDQPTSVVFGIHGGGNGSEQAKDKFAKKHIEKIQKFLDNGVSVAIITRRSIGEVTVEQALLDVARAVQFIRYRSKIANIDKDRIGAFGGSFGASASIWLAFRDDLKDPHNPDPVLRESSRISVAGHLYGQVTFDFEKWLRYLKIKLEELEELRPDIAERIRVFYGIPKDQTIDFDDPDIQKLRREVNMLRCMDSGDAPVYIYNLRPNVEISPETEISIFAHHPIHAKRLANRCKKTGIEHTLILRGTPVKDRIELVDFFLKYLD